MLIISTHRERFGIRLDHFSGQGNHSQRNLQFKHNWPLLSLSLYHKQEKIWQLLPYKWIRLLKIYIVFFIISQATRSSLRSFSLVLDITNVIYKIGLFSINAIYVINEIECDQRDWAWTPFINSQQFIHRTRHTEIAGMNWRDGLRLTVLIGVMALTRGLFEDLMGY